MVSDTSGRTRPVVFFCPLWLIGGRRTHPCSFQAPPLLMEGGWTFQCLKGRKKQIAKWAKLECWRGMKWTCQCVRTTRGKWKERWLWTAAFCPSAQFQWHYWWGLAPKQRRVSPLSRVRPTFYMSRTKRIKYFGAVLPLEVSVEGQKSQRKGINVTGWFLRAPVQQASLQRRNSWSLFKIPKWLKRGFLWACDYAKTTGISGARNLEA